jgi:hypothetical protein
MTNMLDTMRISKQFKTLYYKVKDALNRTKNGYGF